MSRISLCSCVSRVRALAALGLLAAASCSSLWGPFLGEAPPDGAMPPSAVGCSAGAVCPVGQICDTVANQCVPDVETAPTSFVCTSTQTPTLCWDHPYPQGLDLTAAWAVASGTADQADLWAAGPQTVLRFDGTRWQGYPQLRAQLTLTDALSVSSVWATGSSDVWLGLTDCKGAHWDGTAWSLLGQRPCTSAVKQYVAGTNSTDVWFSGDATNTARYTSPSALAQRPHTLAQAPTAILATTAADGWLMTAGGRAAHWNGSAWQPQSLSTSKVFRSLSGTTMGEITAVGDSDEVWRYRTPVNTWALEAKIGPASGKLLAVFHGGDGQRWIAPEEPGAIWYLTDSGAATSIPSTVSVALRAAAGVRNGSVAYMVGDGGAVVRWNGQTPTRLSRAVSYGRLTGMWGCAVNDLWAVGDEGALLHWNGVSWQLVPVTRGSLRAIHGRSCSDIWAVGDAGTILRFNGTQWTALAPPTGAANLNSVFAMPGRTVWAVGDGGFAMVHDGTNQQSLMTSLGKNLQGVWGANDNDVWIVGDDGISAHYTGTFSTPLNGSTATLRTVTGTSTGDVWAGGEQGTLLRFVDNSWVPENLVSITTADTVLKLWALPDGSVRGLTNQGKLLSRENGSWRAYTGLFTPGMIATSLWGLDSAHVWLVGERGMIAHLASGT